MSRNGRKPVSVPAGVEVTRDGARLTVKGPLGELEHALPDELEVDCEPGSITVRPRSQGRHGRAFQGLHRALIANMVEGVSKGFAKVLEIHGTGYSANLRGNELVLQIGFCHEVKFELPSGLSIEVEQNSSQPGRPAKFAIKGADRQAVGQLAAKIRAVRPPEPYKGKGVRYEGEYVRRKEGKAFAGLDR